MFDMEKNASNYNDTDQLPDLTAEHSWQIYEYLISYIHVPPMNDSVFRSSGDLENSRSPYPCVNGTTGIAHQINITNKLPLNNLSQNIICSFVIIICLFGLVGNGIVIWLLGFRLKRNPFTTYILNLSVADFGVLMSLMITATFAIVIAVYEISHVLSLAFLLFLELFFFTYSTGQFLLAAISIDRCVAVLFPLWHRCHRPPHLSSIVCALIWILSFFLSGIHFTLQRTGSFGRAPLVLQLIVNALLCAPLMVISTLILFIYVCSKSMQRQRGKLVTAILLALLFFLLFAFPMNAFYLIHLFYVPNQSLMATGFVFASLNSSINPLIYFLVGSRQKKGKPRVSMTVALQTVFKDEQYCMEEKVSPEMLL